MVRSSQILISFIFLAGISEESPRTAAVPRTASAPTTTSSPRKAAPFANAHLSGLIHPGLPLLLPRSRFLPQKCHLPTSMTAISLATTSSPKRAHPATETLSWIPEPLQMLVKRVERQCDFTGLDAAYIRLQYLWAEVRKGKEQTPSEAVDVLKFLKKLTGHYTDCVEKEDHKIVEIEWEKYMKIFGKKYEAWEKEMRKEIFKKKQKNVEKQNELYRNGRVTYSASLNYFSDWTDEEMEKLNGFRPSNGTLHNNSNRTARYVEEPVLRYYYHNSNITVPASFDWRTKNSVTPVKNQGSCGSCYAIAGNGALEGYHKKRTGDLVILSTQNILDCTWHLANRGCEGGHHATVFKYAEDVGVVWNVRYPYTMNASHNCRWRFDDVVATDDGYYRVESGNEIALMQAVATHGPVGVAIGTNGLSDYQSGVFDNENCGPTRHTALVVGYGTDPEHGDYWIVKNCWGFWWGEDGYVRMARNKNNMCHIATHAYFPY